MSKIKIVPLDLEGPFLEKNPHFKLGDKTIGSLNALLVMSKKERSYLVTKCKMTWMKVINIFPNFVGLIRFDLRPLFSLPQAKWTTWRGMPALEIGILKIGDIYEINARSPECHTAVSFLHWVKPQLKKLQPSATRRFVEAVKETYGDREIVIVQGQGFVKKEWGEVFFKDLKEAGLRFSVMKEGEFMEKPPKGSIVYLYGDYRNSRGPSEFTPEFMQFIKSYPRDLVFNTIPSNGFVSDKSLLKPNIPLNSKEKIKIGLRNKNSWVLKKFLGSSGNNIYMGRLMTKRGWRNTLYRALREGGYGLFPAKWLPCLELPSFGKYALDINVAFWCRGPKLKYLYTISRVDNWDTYWKRGVINVTQGAGFAGTLIED